MKVNLNSIDIAFIILTMSSYQYYDLKWEFFPQNIGVDIRIIPEIIKLIIYIKENKGISWFFFPRKQIVNIITNLVSKDRDCVALYLGELDKVTYLCRE